MPTSDNPLSRDVVESGKRVSTDRYLFTGGPNIKGQINWWQLAVILTSGGITGILAAASHIGSMQGQLSEAIGGVFAMLLVSAITSVAAMLSGRPVKEVAEDIVNKVAGKDDDDAARSDS